jgi:hypothetical protein
MLDLHEVTGKSAASFGRPVTAMTNELGGGGQNLFAEVGGKISFAIP